MTAIVIWATVAWYFGIPTSESHVFGGDAFGFGYKTQIIQNGHILIERRNFGKVADAFFCLNGFIKDVVPVNGYGTFGGSQTTCDDVHRCGFARAIRPQKAVDLSGIDGEAHMFEFSLFLCVE